MRPLGPTPFRRLNEAAGLVFLAGAIVLILCLASYNPYDPSWNSASGARPRNWIGPVGAVIADLLLQGFGLAAFLVPGFALALAWKWLRSRPIDSAWAKLVGLAALLLSTCGGLALLPDWRFFQGAISPGGLVGVLVSGYLITQLNTTGAAVVLATSWLLSIYLISTFSMAALWRRVPAGWFRRRAPRPATGRSPAEESGRPARKSAEPEARAAAEEEDAEIPIRTLEDLPPAPARATPPAPAHEAAPAPKPSPRHAPPVEPAVYQLPPTDLLNEPPARNYYDKDELKEIAAAIKAKFEEFNVFGSVVQINPGPVVTTFEFKPEAGIKYSRITTLTEDLCLGLQAESILIERIPGKPTVGIEVPNSKREVISLRQVLESEEFRSIPSHLPVPLGKDISGRIKVVALDTMPHLLIAGSTGSGKSVMLNSMIMSVLFKSTPEQVRMIVVDPKRVELGIYEGIPHLLTPVITDASKATNALRNAVLEMERRLKLLASHGVRNIEQFNRKVRGLLETPRRLFPELEEGEALRPLPYILIVIDELADLMMLERANVEAAVTRLAQMARAVGMHLVLATQRPSVDVITGLIKANFPARISFRVATRVDSRTILDVMGAEHLLGRGDMLFLPPGSSRLVRVHGALVTESEINRVVEFWKQQARPEYDISFLAAPPSDEDEGEAEDLEASDDPLYEDAVRIVLEMGKASTSILQRRLRLGYGRAARLLDMMQKEGIIGPPDGSRPRDVLKTPDWLRPVEEQRR
jgi:S-DNA-T family DNA segregation ATPase FtsK/SpoIIIE